MGYRDSNGVFIVCILCVLMYNTTFQMFGVGKIFKYFQRRFLMLTKSSFI